MDVFSLPSKKIECGDPNLYPTHPQQSTKLYHSYQTAAYDQTRLRAEDEACKIGSKYENTLGWRPCLLADVAEDAVISDTYQDACGHFYRAAWEVTFLKSDDNMGLLFSRGRTLYPKENAEFENDMYVAQTYPVAAEDFLVITDLFPGDLEKIEAQKRAAEATHSYDPAKGIFIPKKAYK